MQYKDEKADKKRQAAQARIEQTSPEQMSEQNRNAANARWDKHRKNKDMQANAGIDASTMQANAGIDALNINKDKDRDTNKDKDENKDREILDFGDDISSSNALGRSHTNHTPNVANNESDELNDNTPNDNLNNKPSFSDFKLIPPKEVQKQIDDLTTHPNTQIGVRRNHLIDTYLQFIYENGIRKIDLKRFEKLLYYTFWLTYNMNFTEANKQLMYPIDQETFNAIVETFDKLITNKNVLNNYNEYIKANNLK